jgi:UDP-glucose 4-epimerase
MLGICFCCDCCCAVRHGLRLGPPVFWETVSRLPGLTVEVAETCVTCGACADVCYVQAVTMNNGRAHISMGQCKGCGRCLAVCPTGAIGLRMDESVDALGQIMARIKLRTDIGQA